MNYHFRLRLCIEKKTSHINSFWLIEQFSVTMNHQKFRKLPILNEETKLWSCNNIQIFTLFLSLILILGFAAQRVIHSTCAIVYYWLLICFTRFTSYAVRPMQATENDRLIGVKSRSRNQFDSWLNVISAVSGLCNSNKMIDKFSGNSKRWKRSYESIFELKTTSIRRIAWISTIFWLSKQITALTMYNERRHIVNFRRIVKQRPHVFHIRYKEHWVRAAF